MKHPILVSIKPAAAQIEPRGDPPLANTDFEREAKVGIIRGEKYWLDSSVLRIGPKRLDDAAPQNLLGLDGDPFLNPFECLTASSIGRIVRYSG
jgi:hypothetical protein